MSVRIAIDLPDEVYDTLRQRAAAGRTSIRALITDAIDSGFRPAKSPPVTGPLVGRKRSGQSQAVLAGKIPATSYLPDPPVSKFASPKALGDCYLLALSESLGATPVTLDRALASACEK